eukprot:TRINITY_DN15898_c0_g1_i1.p1 TRINITY_DN15898_c0_g1~~TRINITY_DN15898_c0_g1_i1.p1  ORF type:complete len:235 (+),score=44.89 TRINITY_DN15898_c0_g1_i1:47-706(+)
MDVSRKVLVILSAADCVSITETPGSVSGQSLMEAYKVLTTAGYQVVLATPQGTAPEPQLNEISGFWVRDNRQLLTTPSAIHEVNAEHYCGVILPCSIGSIVDLIKDRDLAELLSAFHRSNKPICAIGWGVAALLSTRKPDSWLFEGYSLTAPSNFELVKTRYFGKLPLIVEDTIKDAGGVYSSGSNDSLHVIIDRRLISAQNAPSTSLAVQNFMWMTSR